MNIIAIQNVWYQTAFDNESPLEINCRQPMSSSEPDDQLAIAKVRRTRCYNQTSVW
jgi:hypothetical protein